MSNKATDTKSTTLAARVTSAAILSFVGNLPDKEIAADMNVSVHTVADWKKRPEWNITIGELSIEMWHDAASRLRFMTSKATKVLAEALDDPDPRIRISAAKFFVERGMSNIG